MRTRRPLRKTQHKHPALWDFMQINTILQQLIQRAGRFIRPQGKLKLSMSANTAVQDDLLHILDAMGRVA